MTKLLELKDKYTKIFATYEIYITPVLKFILALVTLLLIRGNIGYMSKISSLPVTIIIALLGALLPINAMIWIFALVLLLDLYALSIEVAATAFVLLAVIYFIYFRFTPKDGVAAILTPVCFRLGIPYVVPVGTGLLGGAFSAISVACGTVLFFFLDGVKQNASVLTSTKLNVTVGQLLGNKEMYMVLAVMAITTVLVYVIRRLKADYAWSFAIVVGIVTQMVGLIVGYIILGVTGKIVMLVVGSVISLLIGFVIQFMFMNLDYARTERVQFEDDEYYYYVKAVPKKMVASEKKTVKHFGNTGSMGKRIEKTKNTK